MREKRGNISFIDMDVLLHEDRYYARDGVHVSDNDHERMEEVQMFSG